MGRHCLYRVMSRIGIDLPLFARFSFILDPSRFNRPDCHGRLTPNRRYFWGSVGPFAHHFWLTKVRYLNTRYTAGMSVRTPISTTVGAGQLPVHIR
jgi:hypothetical protein